MKATLTFANRNQAEEFSIGWIRVTRTGTIVGSGLENVKVTVFDVDEDGKKFIDNYVSKLNNAA